MMASRPPTLADTYRDIFARYAAPWPFPLHKDTAYSDRPLMRMLDELRKETFLADDERQMIEGYPNE
jgi:hypothetical protein